MACPHFDASSAPPAPRTWSSKQTAFGHPQRSRVANNGYVGDIYPKIAYAATPSSARRQFFQSFNREEKGTVPRPGRWVEAEATINFIAAVLQHPRSDRLFRAMGQYALALRHWRFGHETLAVAHLFIASENLTKIALDAELEAKGLDRSGLAEAWEVDDRALDAEVRRQLIFRGDDDTYAAAKNASDGFEHGFLDFDRVRLLSRDVRNATARYIRHTIVEHSGVDAVHRDTLMRPPRDTPLRSFLTRYLWGEFVGEAEDLAMPEFEYPHFEWTSRLAAFGRSGREITITPEETPTARFNEAVQFRPTRMEVWGPEGVHAVQADTAAKVLRADGRIEDVDVTPATEAERPPTPGDAEEPAPD
jgi:hypothetical protein